MTIVAWPVVSRGRVVHAFKPGAPAEAEAPFRTLRSHLWSSAGVRVLPRSSGRLQGQKCIFSSLNVDAAHLARHGYEAAAKRVAEAAEILEDGPEFALLRELLTAASMETTDALLDGVLPEESSLGEAILAIARRTAQIRSASAEVTKVTDILAGQVTEVHEGYVVLRQLGGGSTTAVPRWMAVAVHRDRPGAWLILIVDRLAEASALVDAVPGISLEAELSREHFSPFGRAAKQVLKITESDVAMLSGAPEPLSVVVPVAIEE